MDDTLHGHNVPLLSPSGGSPPEPAGARIDLTASVRSFLDLTGGSILYCLSALFIIYGITKIMGPLLAGSKALEDTLSCIGALNVYELALLGTLVFIVACRHVTDDAISLVVLIPLFLIGSGIALDTVAGKGYAAVGIGAVCAAVGIGKLLVLRRKVRLSLDRYAMAGLALVVIWNFMTGPVWRMVLEDHVIFPAARRSIWLGSLLLLSAGGGLFLAGTVRAKARGRADAGRSLPFLLTPPMACVFALVFFAAAGAHLYALGYVFSVTYAGGDFLLLVTLSALLLVEALIQPGHRRIGPAACVSCAPLAVTLCGLCVPSFFAAPFEWSLELLGHPAFICAAAGAVMLWTAVRTRWVGFLFVAGAYALGAVLTAGLSPTQPFDVNGRLCLGTVAAGLFVLGVVRKRAMLCAAAVLGGTVVLCGGGQFERCVAAVGLSRLGGAAGLAGAGLLAVYALFREKATLLVGLAGAVALAGCAFDGMGPDVTGRDLYVLAPLAATIALVGWRTRAILPQLILCAPIAERAWALFRDAAAWRYVVLSFLLLGVGAWRSSVKGRRAGKSPWSEAAGSG